VSEEINLVVNLSGYTRAQSLEKFMQVENWEVSDPYGADEATYQRIFGGDPGARRDLAQRFRAEKQRRFRKSRGDEVRREQTSVSQEDYLKALWEMLEENQVPISARLAEELNVTPSGPAGSTETHDARWTREISSAAADPT